MNPADAKPPIDMKTVKRVWWANPHSCGDSFMLMLYASKDGSIIEYLWNSREGVTPFGILAKDGRTTLYHELWDRDIYCPAYRPGKGMRIFVNLTENRAREQATRNVEMWWNHPEYPMSEAFESKAEAIDKMAAEYYTAFGEGTTPDIIEVDDAWLAARAGLK